MRQDFQDRESDPRYHTARVKELLGETIEYARMHVNNVNEPKAQALFETTAEVLLGLRKAYEDYELINEPAWRKAG